MPTSTWLQSRCGKNASDGRAARDDHSNTRHIRRPRTGRTFVNLRKASRPPVISRARNPPPRNFIRATGRVFLPFVLASCLAAGYRARITEAQRDGSYPRPGVPASSKTNPSGSFTRARLYTPGLGRGPGLVMLLLHDGWHTHLTERCISGMT